MIKSFKYTALAACSVLALSTSAAFAQSEVVQDADINLTVQNQFSLSYDTELDFGTWAVFCDTGAANTTTITMAANGTPSGGVASGNASVFDIDITGAVAGVFTIADTAPTSTLDITVGDLQNLTCAACGGGNPVITLTSVTPSSGATIASDASGDATFTVGAVITTLASCGTQYLDGLYEGSFDLTVAY